jgi:ribosome maturation factor RimP
VAAGVRLGWQEAVAATVSGLNYELVDVERGQRGLLRVTIDRLRGRDYGRAEGEPDTGEAVTVDDCEQVTRQLQYALEVEGLDYARLEVSSPGLDRPLRREADYQRFAGLAVSVTLKQPFEGRKSWQGLLAAADGGGWCLSFKNGKTEQVLAFTLEEVREARLVPVLDFKGRKSKGGGRSAAADVAPAVEGGKDR